MDQAGDNSQSLDSPNRSYGHRNPEDGSGGDGANLDYHVESVPGEDDDDDDDDGDLDHRDVPGEDGDGGDENDGDYQGRILNDEDYWESESNGTGNKDCLPLTKSYDIVEVLCFPNTVGS